MTKPNTQDVLKERGSKYGNYAEQTRISADIVKAMSRPINRRNLHLEPDQADALQMFAVKISRILNGDPDYSDNWRDIAGYATLVADRLDKSKVEYK